MVSARRVGLFSESWPVCGNDSIAELSSEYDIIPSLVKCFKSSFTSYGITPSRTSCITSGIKPWNHEKFQK